MRSRNLLVAAVYGAALAGCSLAYPLGAYGGDDPAVGDGPDAAAGPEGGADGAATGDGPSPADGGRDEGAPIPDSPCSLKAAGPETPGSVVTQGSGVAWSSPSSALLEDGAGASASLTVTNDESQSLFASNFAFSIPSAASIRGVRVVVRARGVAPDPSEVRDESLRLTPGGVAAGQDKAKADLTGSFVSRDYGGPADSWGLTLTPAMVNAASFGVSFRAKNHDAASGAAEVDVVRVEISYCE